MLLSQLSHLSAAESMLQPVAAFDAACHFFPVDSGFLSLPLFSGVPCFPLAPLLSDADLPRVTLALSLPRVQRLLLPVPLGLSFSMARTSSADSGHPTGSLLVPQVCWGSSVCVTVVSGSAQCPSNQRRAVLCVMGRTACAFSLSFFACLPAYRCVRSSPFRRTMRQEMWLARRARPSLHGAAAKEQRIRCNAVHSAFSGYITLPKAPAAAI